MDKLSGNEVDIENENRVERLEKIILKQQRNILELEYMEEGAQKAALRFKNKMNKVQSINALMLEALEKIAYNQLDKSELKKIAKNTLNKIKA